MEKLEKLHIDGIINSEFFINDKLPNYVSFAEEASKITRKVAIDFSLWQQRGECEWVLNDEDHWVHPYNNKSMTTEGLFDEFLKTYEI